MDLKSQIQSTFKLSGLTVRIEASKYLAGLLAPVPDDDRYANIVMFFINIRHGMIQLESVSLASNAQASVGGQDPGPSAEPEPEVLHHREGDSGQRGQGVHIEREGNCVHCRPSDSDRRF